MGVTRRRFLTIAGTLGLTSTMPAWARGARRPAVLSRADEPAHPADRAPWGATKGAVKLTELHKDTFAAHMGTAFAVKAASGRDVPLVLSEVTGKEDPVLEQFSLVFSGPADAFLPQGTYPFDHPAVGCFAIFIVPIEQTAQGFRYQAVFNRFKN